MRGFLVRVIGWGLSAFGYGVDDTGGGPTPPPPPPAVPMAYVETVLVAPTYAETSLSAPTYTETVLIQA